MVGSFDEPQGAAGILPAEKSEKSTAGEMPAAPWRHSLTSSAFMVPMHAKKRKGPFHDSHGLVAGCANQFSFTPRGNRL
jgi:hypothetical protein